MNPNIMTAIQVGATLLGGGAMGAMITASVSAFRSRKQPILYGIETYPLYGGDELDESIELRVSLTDGGTHFSYDNMHVVYIHFQNKGTQDLQSLIIGVTLPSEHKIIKAAYDTPSRHHAVNRNVEISPASPVSEVDFTLGPLNRADGFGITLYVVDESSGQTEIGDVELSSPHAVRFVGANAWKERLANFGTIVAVGPLRLSVGFD